tara:strand:+ start:308 stop:715 length:408 start_codon:yes stop_codon:yes gene_type:complete
MKMPNRHKSRLGRMLLVLMFVFTSIVPGSLHAFAMTEAQTVNGGGHHTMMGHLSGGQPTATHHQSQGNSADFAQESIPTGQDTVIDRCCPASCFVALCYFAAVAVDRFIPEGFEIGLTPEFVVVVMALPERPPRA